MTDGGQTEQHPLDVATGANKEVNQILADTDGAISSMQFEGAIGYHINIASGETDPEHLWRAAFHNAIDQVLLEMAFVDADTPEAAREQLEEQVLDQMGPFSRDAVADRFEENLRGLIETQEGKQ